MAIFSKGAVPWNSLDNNTRLPSASELETGYPCGEADRQLFNFTSGYAWGLAHNVILNAGLTPDRTDLLQLATAIQSGKLNYALAAGTANVIALTLTPAPEALSAGLVVDFVATNNNTGAVTLNVNSLGAVALTVSDGSSLVSGDIISGRAYTALYDGVAWRLLQAAKSTTTRRGIVELATNAETLALTDAERAVTPAGLKGVRDDILSRSILSESQSYTAAGTHNWTAPTGVTRVRYRLWGGGGGGGGCGLDGGAAGGGSGAYVEGVATVVPGVSYPAAVGVAGAGGAAGGGNGSPGGPSTFGGASAGGGGGGSGSASGYISPPGTGGTGTGGSLRITGGDGATAIPAGDRWAGGAGAGAPGGGSQTPYSLAAAWTGRGPGGGGAAGGSRDDPPNAGGAGAAGMVVLEWG